MSRRTFVAGGASTLILAAGAGSILSAPAHAQGAGAGYVTAYQGRVGLSGSGGVRTLQTTMPVAVGDRALTGGGARVTLRFEGGVAVTAGPETDMEVVAHAPSSFGWRGELRIRRGAVRIEIPPGAPVDRFTVVTPTAHVSTRQAHAVVETTPLLTSVFADTGRVLVSGVEGPDEAVTVLGPGFGVDVMRRQSAYDPLRWDPSRIQALMQRTSYP